MVILTPALAFAAPKNSANLELEQPVTVAGTQLAPGQYKVVWQGSGSDIAVSFMEGKQIIATAPAKLVNNPTGEEAIETDIQAGKTVLQAIDLKKISLQFENAATNSGN